MYELREYPQEEYEQDMRTLLAEKGLSGAIKIYTDKINEEITGTSYIVRTLKSISAIEMFKAYPQLKQFYSRCGVLWSRGYFVSTVGHISDATVKKYIAEQKNHD